MLARYTDPTGTVFVGDPDVMMKRFADDQFKGKIEPVREAEPAPPEALLFARIAPYNDPGADLVVWRTSPVTGNQEPASYYESGDYAENLCDWVNANQGEKVKLTPYTEGRSYQAARDEAKLFAAVTPVPTKPSRPIPPTPEAFTAPEIVERVTMTGAGGTVSAIAVERIARHEAALKAVGIDLAPPVYAPGSRVVDLGVRNFKTMHEKWEATPKTQEALRDVSVLIKHEDREDLDVSATAIRMRDDGRILVNGQVLGLEEQGLLQLARNLRIEEELQGRMRLVGWEDGSTLMPGAGPFLMTLDPDVRAFVFNKCMAKVDTGQDVKLRTRNAPDGKGRSTFAVTGTGYGVFDADQVAEVIAEVLESGQSMARGPVTYDGSNTTLKAEAIWMPDSIVDLAAGDVFKVGGTFRSNDAGSGSIKGGGTAWRNRCLNLIIIGEGSVEVFRIMHRGGMDQVRKDLVAGVRKIPALFETFLQEWGFLRETKLAGIELFGKTYTNAKDAITALVKDGRIEVNVGKDALVEYMLQSYAEEPGDTLADIVNSLTRAAHEKLVSDIVRDNMERAAGRLVPVLVRQAELAVA